MASAMLLLLTYGWLCKTAIYVVVLVCVLCQPAMSLLVCEIVSHAVATSSHPYTCLISARNLLKLLFMLFFTINCYMVPPTHLQLTVSINYLHKKISKKKSSRCRDGWMHECTGWQSTKQEVPWTIDILDYDMHSITWPHHSTTIST